VNHPQDGAVFSLYCRGESVVVDGVAQALEMVLGKIIDTKESKNVLYTTIAGYASMQCAVLVLTQ